MSDTQSDTASVGAGAKPGRKPSRELVQWYADPAEALDDLCDRITGGETLTSIGRSLNTSNYTLANWIAADSDRSARVREARKAAAAAHDDAALQEIKDAPDPFSLAKAREVASHLRWRASKADPGRYGDKLDVTQTVMMRNVPDAELRAKAEKLLSIVNGYQEPVEVSENAG